MTTINELQNKMKSFNTFSRNAIDNESPEQAIQEKWESLFHIPLEIESAKSFIKYYRNMRSNKKSQRTQKTQKGGSAPLNYDMAPGLNPPTYGRFPVAIDTDSQSIQDLDVYFQNSLTKGCGTENSSLTIPEGMGSNMVGGSKQRKNTRKANRKASRKVNRKESRKMNRKASRKVNRKASRKSSRKNQRGGLVDYTNLGSSLYMRPSLSTVPINPLTQISSSLSGATTTIPAPASPSAHTWGYVSNGTAGLIDPNNVTFIPDNFSKLASPAPWQTQF